MSHAATDALRFLQSEAGLLAESSRRLLIGLTRIYQQGVSPLLGPRCRFYPSCSEYYVEALKKYPLARAHLKTCTRLAKCGPWHPGGIDLP